MKYIIKDNKVEYLDLRFYKFNDDYYPSVTTILSCYPKDITYYDWLKNMGQNADIIRNKAAEVGSNVHKAIELLLKGDQLSFDNYTIEEWSLINKAHEFFTKYKFTDIITEFNVVKPKLGYGGTIDFIGTYNGKRYMIDFKTSNYMSETMFMQLEAYRSLVDESIDYITVLHLKSNTRTDKDFQGNGWRLEFPDKNIDYNRLFFITKELFDHKCKSIKPILTSYKLKLGL